MWRTATLICAPDLVAGCGSMRPVEGPVRLGQVAAANGPRIRPNTVLEDSRCPLDVTCVSAGRLIVRATVFGGGWSRQLDLTLGAPVHVADGSLALVAATPARRGSRPAIAPRSYRFTFLFQGGL